MEPAPATARTRRRDKDSFDHYLESVQQRHPPQLTREDCGDGNSLASDLQAFEIQNYRGLLIGKEAIPLNVLERAINLRRSSRNYANQVSITVTDNDAATHWIMGVLPLQQDEFLSSIRGGYPGAFRISNARRATAVTLLERTAVVIHCGSIDEARTHQPTSKIADEATHMMSVPYSTTTGVFWGRRTPHTILWDCGPTLDRCGHNRLAVDNLKYQRQVSLGRPR